MCWLAVLEIRRNYNIFLHFRIPPTYFSKPEEKLLGKKVPEFRAEPRLKVAVVLPWQQLQIGVKLNTNFH